MTKKQRLWRQTGRTERSTWAGDRTASRILFVHKRNNAALYLYWFPYKDLGFPQRNPPLDYGPETTIVQGQFEDVELVLWKASWLTQREMFAQCVQRVLLSDHMVQPTYPRLHDIGHQRTNTNDPVRKKKEKECWQQAYESVFEGAACEDGCRLKAETHMGGYVEQGPVQRTNGWPIEEDAHVVIDSCLMLS